MKKDKKVGQEGRKPSFEKGANQGDTLTKEYHGKVYKIAVKADGFHYDDKVYTSISKIASIISGVQTNGPLFFGLRGTTKAKAPGKGGKKSASREGLRGVPQKAATKKHARKAAKKDGRAHMAVGAQTEAVPA